MFLVGLSGTTTTIRKPIGPIRENPQTRAFLLDVMREVVAVGRAHGVDLAEDYAEVRLQLRRRRVAYDMTSSMHHDLERGNPLEVRWLAGGVVELGRAKGVPTPLNRAIADILALHADGQAAHEHVPASACRTDACAAFDAAPRWRCRMRYVLGTSAATVRAAPLLLVDVETEQGITGPHVYLLLPAKRRAVDRRACCRRRPKWCTASAVAPAAMAAMLERRFALIGVTGVVRMALSALDMALWDALAIAADVPLATLLGGEPRPMRPTTRAASA